MVINNLKNGHKFVNLVDYEIACYCDKTPFLQVIGPDLAYHTSSFRLELLKPKDIELATYHG